MSALFSTFQLKDVSLRNRIAVASMCQYQAQDGIVNDWHFTHYSSLGRGGSGLVIVEATAVSPEGRITPGCTGLWKDEQTEGMAKVAALIQAAGAVPGIQIGQAARQVPIFPGKATIISQQAIRVDGRPLHHLPLPLAAAFRRCLKRCRFPTSTA